MLTITTGTEWMVNTIITGTEYMVNSWLILTIITGTEWMVNTILTSTEYMVNTGRGKRAPNHVDDHSFCFSDTETDMSGLYKQVFVSQFNT